MKLTYILVISCILFLTVLQASAEESATPGRFQNQGDGIILDTHSGLMWAARDNGSDTNFYDAKQYCEDFTAGGYDDWRLPDIKELAALRTVDQKNADGHFIDGVFKLSECCMWSSYDSMGGAAIFNFRAGKKSFGYFRDEYQLRALPVRGSAAVITAGQ